MQPQDGEGGGAGEQQQPAPEVPTVAIAKSMPVEPSRSSEQDETGKRHPPIADTAKTGMGALYTRHAIRLSHILIAAATVVNVVVAGCQFRAIGDANREAKRSAEAALRAVETDRLAQRAYLTMPNLVSANYTDPKTGRLSHIGLAPRWENTGTTPTATARAVSNWAIQKAPMDVSFDFKDRITVSDPAPFLVLGARAGTNMTRFAFPIDVLQSVTRGESYLYLFGWVAYRDVFPETPLRLTRYCVRVTRVIFSLPDILDPRNTVTPNFSQCRTGNCLDEQCPDYAERISSELPLPEKTEQPDPKEVLDQLLGPTPPPQP